MADHNDIGKKGELLAAEYLTANGYSILERNWRFDRAEIDIIAQKGNIIAIVEVKTRTYDDFIAPQEAVNPKKIKQLVKCADAYMTRQNDTLSARFDIVTVVMGKTPQIEHIEDAFYHF